MTHEDVERLLANHERWLERHAEEITLLTKVQLEQHQIRRELQHEHRELQQTMASVSNALGKKTRTRQ